MQRSSEAQLEMTHLSYLGWPDHGVPFNGISLIEFIKRVRKIHPPSHHRPLLVHCSAGVGRTGTFVVLDGMMQMMTAENALNVYLCVKQLRDQRVKMVQTMVIHPMLGV